MDSGAGETDLEVFSAIPRFSERLLLASDMGVGYLDDCDASAPRTRGFGSVYAASLEESYA